MDSNPEYKIDEFHHQILDNDEIIITEFAPSIFRKIR